jgi:hypothetical protein
MLGLPLSMIWSIRSPAPDPSGLADHAAWQATLSRLGFGLVSFAGGLLVMVVADLSQRLRAAQSRIEKLEGSSWHGGRLQSAETRIEQLEADRRDERRSAETGTEQLEAIRREENRS